MSDLPCAYYMYYRLCAHYLEYKHKPIYTWWQRQNSRHGSRRSCLLFLSSMWKMIMLGELNETTLLAWGNVHTQSSALFIYSEIIYMYDLYYFVPSLPSNNLSSYVMQMTNRRDVEEYFHDLLGQENARTKDFLKHFFIHWRPPQRQPSPPLVQELHVEPLVRLPEDELVLFVEKKSNVKEKSKPSKVPLFCHMEYNLQFHNYVVCNEVCVSVSVVCFCGVCFYSNVWVCICTWSNTHSYTCIHTCTCMYVHMHNCATPLTPPPPHTHTFCHVCTSGQQTGQCPATTQTCPWHRRSSWQCSKGTPEVCAPVEHRGTVTPHSPAARETPMPVSGSETRPCQ